MARRGAWSPFRYGQYGTFGRPDDGFSNASDEKPAEPRSSMRSHHDKVNPVLVRILGDCCRSRVTLAYGFYHVDVCREICGKELFFQVSFILVVIFRNGNIQRM